MLIGYACLWQFFCSTSITYLSARFTAVSKWNVQWVALKRAFNTWPWSCFYYVGTGTYAVFLLFCFKYILYYDSLDIKSLRSIAQARCGLYELSLRPWGLLLLFPWALQCSWQVRCSRPPTIARRGCTGSPIWVLDKRRSTSEVLKGNVLGYYRKLGFLSTASFI